MTADAATAALLADDVADVAASARACAPRCWPRSPRSREPADVEPRVARVRHDARGAERGAALRPPRRAAETEPDRRRARWGARAWFALAASLALLVGVGWGAVFVGEQLNRPGIRRRARQIEAAPDAQAETVTLSDGGDATAHWSESVGKAVLVTDGLPTIADDQSFELWFVRDGAPDLGGHLRPTADGSATALLDGAMEPGDVIAVTVEAAGRLAHRSADNRSDRRDSDAADRLQRLVAPRACAGSLEG